MPHCVAYQCNNRTGNRSSLTTDSDIYFHIFPTDKHLRAIRINNIRRMDFSPSEHSKICSCHFASDQFASNKLAQYGIESATRRKAKQVEGAVPTLFPFNVAEEVKGRASSIDRFKKRDAASLVASLLSETGSGSAQSRPTVSVTACSSTGSATTTRPSPGPTTSTSALGSTSDMVGSDRCDVSIPSLVYIKFVKLWGHHPISNGEGGWSINFEK